MYYLLFYKTVENYIERRAPYRAEHLKMAQEAADSGQLVMGGALADPADGGCARFQGRQRAGGRSLCQKRPLCEKWPDQRMVGAALDRGDRGGKVIAPV